MTTSIWLLEASSPSDQHTSKLGRTESSEPLTNIICKFGQVATLYRHFFDGAEEVFLAEYTVEQVELFLAVLCSRSKSQLTGDQFTSVLACATATGRIQVTQKLQFCQILNTFLLLETINEEAITSALGKLKKIGIHKTKKTPYYAVCRYLGLYLKRANLSDCLTVILPRKFPNCLPILTLYARACTLAGEKKKGIECLKKAAAQSHGPAVYLWGLHLLSQGEKRQALTQFKSAALTVPLGRTACYAVGLQHYENKNYECAAKFWQRGVELDGPYSKSCLAELLAKGCGVTRDRHRSGLLKEEAAKAGVTYPLIEVSKGTQVPNAGRRRSPQTRSRSTSGSAKRMTSAMSPEKKQPRTKIWLLEPVNRDPSPRKRTKTEASPAETLIHCKNKLTLKANAARFEGKETINLSHHTCSEVELFLAVCDRLTDILTAVEFNSVLACAEAAGCTQLKNELEFSFILNDFLSLEAIDDKAVTETEDRLNALELKKEPGDVYYAVCECLRLWGGKLTDALTLIAPDKYPNILPVFTLYARGRIKTDDRPLEWELLKNTASRGHGPASHLLGLRNLKQGNTTEAVALFQQASDNGAIMGPVACYMLGIYYNKHKKFKNAALWWKRGAERGEPRCMANYALLLYHGRGVEEDQDLALQWRERAAAAGSLHSAVLAGVCHYKRKDYVNARKYLAMAGDHKVARYYLGLCHRDGLGGDPDMEQACRYLKQAADLGHKKAKKLHLKITGTWD